MAANIARVFVVAGELDGEGHIHWGPVTPSDPDITLLDTGVRLDFGDAVAVLNHESAERLVRALVSAVEAARAKRILSSGPVADMMAEFMSKFGAPPS